MAVFALLGFCFVLGLVEIERVAASQPTLLIGIDGSRPPVATSWRLAKTYFPLEVQENVDISFKWLGHAALVITTNETEYLACEGNGTVLAPADSFGGSYIFYPPGLGTYYFYNNDMSGALCRAGMRTLVNVVGPKECGSATTKKLCSYMTQCKWNPPVKRRKGRCVLKPANRRRHLFQDGFSNLDLAYGSKFADELDKHSDGNALAEE